MQGYNPYTLYTKPDGSWDEDAAFADAMIGYSPGDPEPQVEPVLTKGKNCDFLNQTFGNLPVDNRSVMSVGPKFSAFDRVVNKVVAAAPAVQKWMSETKPSTMGTQEQVARMLEQAPSEFKELFQEVKKADNFAVNFTTENPVSETPRHHREVKWAVEKWVNKAENLVLEHTAHLSTCTEPTGYSSMGKYALQYHFGWTYRLEGATMSNSLKEKLEKKLWFQVDHPEKHVNLAIVGPTDHVPKGACDSYFILSLLQNPVGAMVKVEQGPSVIHGTFHAKKNHFSTLTCLKEVTQQFEFNAEAVREWIFTPYYPFEPTYVPYKMNNGKKAAPISNPYSKAFCILRDLPYKRVKSVSVPQKTIPLRSAPTRSVRFANAIPAAASPVYVHRELDDVPAAFTLSSDSDNITLALHLNMCDWLYIVPNPDVTFTYKVNNKPHTVTSKIPTHLCYEGWVIARRGILVNPVVTASNHIPADASVNYLPLFALHMFIAIGGLLVTEWSEKKPHARELYWAMPDWGAKLTPLHVIDGKLTMLAPFSWSDAPSGDALHIPIAVNSNDWYLANEVYGVNPGTRSDLMNNPEAPGVENLAPLRVEPSSSLDFEPP